MRVVSDPTLPLALVLASGCWRRTQLAATWHEPSPTLLNFNRTVAVFVTTDESMRRAVEDQLADGVPEHHPVVPRRFPMRPAPTRGRSFSSCATPASTARSSCASPTCRSRSPTTPRTGRTGAARYGFAGYWGTAWAYPVQPVLRDDDPDRLRRDEHLLAQGRQARLRGAEPDLRSRQRGQADPLRDAPHQRAAAGRTA